MQDIVWPAPLYAFLRLILDNQQEANAPLEKKILDCGAGGKRPPLALFHAHGFEAHGIDISDKQIQYAHEFCQEKGIELDIRRGDMRAIPFEDGAFGFVYEFYSLCHLTKQDTALAVREMFRVLKKGGVCFLGFMSAESWPITGQEARPGEFLLYEYGDEPVIHSVYGDDEPDSYFTGLEVVQKEKRTVWYPGQMATISREEWVERFRTDWTTHSREQWTQLYDERIWRGNYTHLFYIVRKVAA